MTRSDNTNKSSQPKIVTLTVIEFGAGVLVVSVPLLTGKIVAEHFGAAAGVAAGTVNCILSILVVIVFYRVVGRIREREERDLLNKYPSIYRVTAPPANTRGTVNAEGAQVQLGDYGWEAEPILNDGRVYLQGLTTDWRVVWYAGFARDEIELICAKPRSQYYLPCLWGREIPDCPFPVQPRQNNCNDLGYPYRIIGGFVQGQRVRG